MLMAGWYLGLAANLLPLAGANWLLVRDYRPGLACLAGVVAAGSVSWLYWLGARRLRGEREGNADG